MIKQANQFRDQDFNIFFLKATIKFLPVINYQDIVAYIMCIMYFTHAICMTRATRNLDVVRYARCCTRVQRPIQARRCRGEARILSGPKAWPRPNRNAMRACVTSLPTAANLGRPECGTRKRVQLGIPRTSTHPSWLNMGLVLSWHM